MWRTRAGSAAGTSSGRTGAACRHPFAAIRPSSRSVFHRKNSPSSRDKTETPRTPAKARSRGGPLPSVARADRSTPNALAPAGCASTAVGPSARDGNCRATRSGAASPQGYARSDSIRHSVCGAMPLRFGRKFLPGPSRESGSFGVAHVNRPRQRQWNRSKHRSVFPLRVRICRKRTRSRAPRNADAPAAPRCIHSQSSGFQ